MAELDQGVEHGVTINQRAGRRIQGERHDLPELLQNSPQLATLRAAVLTRSMGRRLDSCRCDVSNLKGVLHGQNP